MKNKPTKARQSGTRPADRLFAVDRSLLSISEHLHEIHSLGRALAIMAAGKDGGGSPVWAVAVAVIRQAEAAQECERAATDACRDQKR